MWFSRGSILLAVGIVGEYVGRIYMNLNRSPQFIVRQHFPVRRPDSSRRAEWKALPSRPAGTGKELSKA